MAASTIHLTAGDWKMMVYRQVHPQDTNAFGVRYGGNDYIGTQFTQSSGAGAASFHYLDFTLAADTDVEFIGNSDFTGRTTISPGDVIAFAPMSA